MFYGNEKFIERNEKKKEPSSFFNDLLGEIVPDKFGGKKAIGTDKLPKTMSTLTLKKFMPLPVKILASSKFGSFDCFTYILKFIF